MKRISTFLAAICLALVFNLPSFAQMMSETLAIQLVESVPIETRLGVAETGRTLPVWLDMIHHAHQSIEIGCFYLSNEKDEPLQQILTELATATQRGVKVRILTDLRMSGSYPQTLAELTQLRNLQVARTDYYNRRGGVMHAKYLLIDRKEVFLGSQNFDWRALKHIHETGLRIVNDRLAQMFGLIFDLDWQVASSGKTVDPKWLVGHLIDSLSILQSQPVINAQHLLQLPFANCDSVRLYPTFSPQESLLPGMAWDEEELVKLLDQAKKEIVIQLLSYATNEGKTFYPVLDNALRRAATRGVQVKIILADWSSSASRLPQIKSLAVIPNIEIKFSSIPPWSGGFVPYARVEHCKYLVVDHETGWLGTANWSWDYFYASRNVGIVFIGKGVSTLLRQVFYKSWDSDYVQPVDACKDYKPPKISE